MSRRGDQIGPSSHTNSYCRGVLVSNWSEERLLDIERTQSKPAPVKMESTYSTSFANPAVKADGASLAPPPLCKAPDAGQHLLLGHSSSSSNQNNNNNSVSIKKKNSSTYMVQTTIGHQEEVPSGSGNNSTMPIKKVDTLQAKQMKWKQERDPDFARHGIPQMAQVQHEKVRSKAPHFVQDFSEDPTILRLRQ